MDTEFVMHDTERLTTEYRHVHRATMRSTARHAALEILSRTVGSSLARWDRTPRVQFLVMHHVFEDERANFERLVQKLANHFEFVSYSEAVRRLHAGKSDRPCLAISFDDGLKNCLVAAEVLERYGAKACFFVCPRLVGEQEFDEVARICRERWKMPPTEIMTWDDLEVLVQQGHEVGGHTMGHPYMHRLRKNEAELEIGCCRAILLKRFGVADHFAWPYGGFHHMLPEFAASVFEGGFVSCASGARGAHALVPGAWDAAQPFCLHRDSIVAAWPVRHAEYFLAKSAANLIGPQETWPEEWSVRVESQAAA